MQPGSHAPFQLSTGKGLFLSRGLVLRRPNKVTPAPIVFRWWRRATYHFPWQAQNGGTRVLVFHHHQLGFGFEGRVESERVQTLWRLKNLWRTTSRGHLTLHYFCLRQVSKTKKWSFFQSTCFAFILFRHANSHSTLAPMCPYFKPFLQHVHS
jgi:hypothetical protein